MPDSGNSAQTRIIAEQVAEATITQFVSAHPELRQAAVVSEIPPVLKWAAGAISALGLAAVIGLGVWLVSSVSTMRETLARMDERQLAATQSQGDWRADMERRVSKIEATRIGERAE